MGRLKSLSSGLNQRSHTYLGYVLRLQGSIDDEERVFVVAMGGGVHAKHQFRVGDELSVESAIVCLYRT